MTGHGRGEASFQGVKVVVELHSVNHRQFDLRLDLPHFLSSLETEARRLVHDGVARGSISCRVHVESGGEIALQHLVMDNGLVRRYLRVAREAAKKHGLEDDLGTSALFNLPGVVKLLPIDAGRRLKGPLEHALRGARRELIAMRAMEGRALAEDIDRRLRLLVRLLEKIERRLPFIRRRYKNKIRELTASCVDNNADKKIIREIVLAAERFDVAEELTRSESHLKQFYGLLEKGGPVGRTMDFLIQEMVREINTLGSKANDCAVSNLVIEYKSELECVREQAQNIE